MKKSKTFQEQYEITYDFQRDDGYWTCGAKTDVFVAIEHGVNEKNNHDKAKKLFLKQNPKAIIKAITYC